MTAHSPKPTADAYRTRMDAALRAARTIPGEDHDDR